MNRLALRAALCVLGLACALLGFAVAIVVALGDAVPMAALARTGLLVLLLPLVLSVFTWLRTKALSAELTALDAYARTAATDERALPVPRFAEAAAVGGALSALRERVRASQLSAAASHKRFSDAQALRVRFIAAMGHDLRSPLNAMLGFADLLALARPEALLAAQHRNLEIIRERARDLLALIDAMVDWARLEAGELTLSSESVDASAVILEAVELAKARSGARGLQVQCELVEPLGHVHADAKRLCQALLGLMDHAARSEERPTLQVRACLAFDPRAGRVLRVEVTDPQLEIRREDRSHVFEAFRASFAPTGKRIAGLSLGTAIARALMRAQGGDVWFESRPERGTMFVLTAAVTSLA